MVKIFIVIDVVFRGLDICGVMWVLFSLILKGVVRDWKGKKMGRMWEIKDVGLKGEKFIFVLIFLLCYFYFLLYIFRGRDRGKWGDLSYELFVL